MAQGGSVRRAAISERAFGNPLSHNYGSGAEANLAPAPSDCAGLRAGLGRGVLSVGRMAVQPAQSFAGVGGRRITGGLSGPTLQWPGPMAYARFSTWLSGSRGTSGQTGDSSPAKERKTMYHGATWKHCRVVRTLRDIVEIDPLPAPLVVRRAPAGRRTDADHPAWGRLRIPE